MFKFAFLSSETLKECEEALETRLTNQGPLFIGPPKRNSHNSRPGSNHLRVPKSLASVTNVIRKDLLYTSPPTSRAHLGTFPPRPCACNHYVSHPPAQMMSQTRGAGGRTYGNNVISFCGPENWGQGSHNQQPDWGSSWYPIPPSCVA
jgi:hypothetical protein